MAYVKLSGVSVKIGLNAHEWDVLAQVCGFPKHDRKALTDFLDCFFNKLVRGRAHAISTKNISSRKWKIVEACYPGVIQRALDGEFGLTPQQREILRLRAGSLLTPAETARVLGKSLSSIYRIEREILAGMGVPWPIPQADKSVLLARVAPAAEKAYNLILEEIHARTQHTERNDSNEQREPGGPCGDDAAGAAVGADAADAQAGAPSPVR